MPDRIVKSAGSRLERLVPLLLDSLLQYSLCILGRTAGEECVRAFAEYLILTRFHLCSDWNFVRERKFVPKNSPKDSQELPNPDMLLFSLQSAQSNLGLQIDDVTILTADFPLRSTNHSIVTGGFQQVSYLEHSFNVLQQLRDIMDFRRQSGKRALLNAFKTKIGSTPLLKSQTGVDSMTFTDEAGKMRTAQWPAWLKSKRFHLSIKIVDMWSAACIPALSIKDDAAFASVSQDAGLVHRTFRSVKQWLPFQIELTSRREVSDTHTWALVASYACKQKRFPTFNPSVVRNVGAEFDSGREAFVLAERHHFFGQKLTTTDFYSPIYGPIFRLAEAGVGVGEAAKQQAESHRLLAQISSNTLLSLRFGQRDRSRLLDLPVVIVHDLMQEVRGVWRKELMSSSLSRETASTDIDLVHLYTHYTIERHREALLWSFLVARHDTNGDDVYGSKELSRMLSEVNMSLADLPSDTKPRIVHHTLSRHISPDQYRENHIQAGVTPPSSNTVVFTSLHGINSMRNRLAEDYTLQQQNHTKIKRSLFQDTTKEGATTREACRFASICFEPLLRKSPVRASEYFKHVTLSHWGCGDCSK